VWLLTAEVDNFADAQSVHFYYRDDVLTAEDYLPNSTANKWVYLGESAKDGTHFIESGPVGRAYAASQEIAESFANKWTGLETALVNQLGVDSSKFAEGEPRYWWDQPPVFGAKFVLAAVAEHKDGAAAGSARYSQPFYWSGDGPSDLSEVLYPVQSLYEPVEDHPDWGGSGKNYPELIYSSDKDLLVVRWTDPSRTAGLPTDRYDIGLFVQNATVGWQLVKSVSFGSPQDGGPYEEEVYNSVPDGSYFARVIPMSPEGVSQTNLVHNTTGSNVIDLTQPVFGVYLGGRSNSVTITKDTGPTNDFVTTGTEPGAGATVNKSLRAGTSIYIMYNYQPDGGQDSTYGVQVNGVTLENQKNYQIFGHSQAHEIYFTDVPDNGSSGQWEVKVVQQNVTSSEADAANGFPDLSNPTALMWLYKNDGGTE
jgi:hypothetical protein